MGGGMRVPPSGRPCTNSTNTTSSAAYSDDWCSSCDATSAGWSGRSSSSSCPTSITRYSDFSGIQSNIPIEISAWSDSEDEVDDTYDWDDACSIITEDIELDTVEQLFVSFMSSMTDFLNTSLRPTRKSRRSATEPPHNAGAVATPPRKSLTFSPSHASRSASVDSSSTTPVRKQHPSRSPSGASAPDHYRWPDPPTPISGLIHSASMPLPVTEPAPWHLPRGHTPEPEPCRSSRESDADGPFGTRFSVALARMEHWEARNAAAVTHAVYRRHAGIPEEDEKVEDAEESGGRWEGQRGRRRNGMICTNPLGLGSYTNPRNTVPITAVSVVGRGIAYYPAEPRKKSIKARLGGHLRRVSRK